MTGRSARRRRIGSWCHLGSKGRHALEVDPYLVPALINLANIHYSRDEIAEAQALYERAISLESDVFEAHFNLGNILHDLGRYPEWLDIDAIHRPTCWLAQFSWTPCEGRHMDLGGPVFRLEAAGLPVARRNGPHRVLAQEDRLAGPATATPANTRSEGR